MKIVVRSPGERGLHLWIPSGLALNPVGAMFLPKVMEQNGMELDRKQALALVRAINRYRRRHPDWVLVEVQGAGGEYVQVKL